MPSWHPYGQIKLPLEAVEKAGALNIKSHVIIIKKEKYVYEGQIYQ